MADKVIVTKSLLDDLANDINEASGESGSKTIAQMRSTVQNLSASGGYYTPSVAQEDDSTMVISYAASSGSMPAVEPVEVTLPAGPAGADGKDGVTGPQGPKGDTGETGPAGPQGPQGEKGDTGSQGIQGEKGEKGDTGAKGEKGDTGPSGAAGKDGQDGYTPVRGVDYWTDADKAEIKEELPLVKSAEQPDFVNSIEEMVDTSKVYVMPDGYLYGYRKIENYNLLKLSEVSYLSRLDNASSEIITSSDTNFVTGWFPVTPGKYYVSSIYRSDLEARVNYSPRWMRVQLKLADGSIKIYTNTSGGDEYPYTTLADTSVVRTVSVENAVAMRVHMAMQVNGTAEDVSDADKLAVWKTMIVEGDTAQGAADKAKNLDYVAGDTGDITEWYNTGLAYNQPADYEGRVVALESDVSELQEEVETLGNPASASPYYREVNFGQIPTSYYQGVGESYSAEGFGKNTKYADFIAAWKSLVANHSTYVTETELGTASDGQPIYLYDFKPVQITNPDKPIPKIIIVTGQHGWEKADAYGLYYLAGNLLNNWDKHPVLDYLRNHVELMIVPFVNTYGFDNFTYKNANEVNINRNYDSNWKLVDDTTSSQYGGAEPFDQPESQLIRDLILANPAALMVIDFHVCNQDTPASYAQMTYYGVCTNTDDYYNRMVDVAAYQLAATSAHFNIDYEQNQPDTIMGFLNHFGGTGLLRDWATDNNFIGVLVEGTTGFPGGMGYDPKIFKVNEEIMANYLVTALYYLTK